MGKVAKRIASKLVPEACDRHANKLDIYKTRGHLYHVNFRNLQIRLSSKQFEHWKHGFNMAQERLQVQELMSHDTLEPWKEEQDA